MAVILKSLAWMVLSHVKDITGHHRPLQFASRMRADIFPTAIQDVVGDVGQKRSAVLTFPPCGISTHPGSRKMRLTSRQAPQIQDAVCSNVYLQAGTAEHFCPQAFSLIITQIAIRVLHFHAVLPQLPIKLTWFSYTVPLRERWHKLASEHHFCNKVSNYTHFIFQWFQWNYFHLLFRFTVCLT